MGRVESDRVHAGSGAALEDGSDGQAPEGGCMKRKFKVGDICHHPEFGACTVVSFDRPRGLIQVKWPLNGSSYAFWSLVEPGTLTKGAA